MEMDLDFINENYIIILDVLGCLGTLYLIYSFYYKPKSCSEFEEIIEKLKITRDKLPYFSYYYSKTQIYKMSAKIYRSIQQRDSKKIAVYNWVVLIYGIIFILSNISSIILFYDGLSLNMLFFALFALVGFIITRYAFYESEEMWNCKGLAMNYLKNYELAIKCYNKSIEINPNLRKVWNNKGKTLDILGKHKEAIKCFDKTIELFQKDIPEKSILIRILKIITEESFEFNTIYDEAWHNKGIALFNLRKYKEAEKCFNKVLEMSTEIKKPWYNKGVSQQNLSKYEEALKYFDKVSWAYKGMILCEFGDYKAGIKCFDKALQLSPSFQLALYYKEVAVKKLGL